MVGVPLPWARFSSALEGLVLPDDFFTRVEIYLDALSEINQSLNLISFSTKEELFGHVVDALQVLRVAPEGPLRLIDVGTGGGLPGVPLALARPSWSVTLLDSLRKKQAAVSSLLETAKVSNAQAVWGRAEEVAHGAANRETYDGALCRAVGRLTTVLELTVPFLKIGGSAYLHRGSDGREELALASPALTSLGGKIGPIFPYRLPGLDKDRLILCIEKTYQTLTGFPRRAGMPAKRPL
jgi:16S rRNA (guanine527-N7)-methyltransferase